MMHLIQILYYYRIQITYSVPYALVSSRIEPLGLGQGMNFLLMAKFLLQRFSPATKLMYPAKSFLWLWLNFCRAINGRAESGYCDPSGIILFFLFRFMKFILIPKA